MAGRYTGVESTGVYQFSPTTFTLFEGGHYYCLNAHLQTVVSRTNVINQWNTKTNEYSSLRLRVFKFKFKNQNRAKERIPNEY